MSLDPAFASTLGTVRVVGTGLLGTSVGLGLAGSGVRVLLDDPSPTALALARDLGAGDIGGGAGFRAGGFGAGGFGADDLGGGVGVQGPEGGPEPEPGLVVVAAPPDVTATVVLAQLKAYPRATVTDVASVKSGIAAELDACGADLGRYVGGHPLAGRERSGPVAARGDLFLGRPWAVCPASVTEQERVATVQRLALALGAVPVTMTAREHDDAVALVSHLPQVAASLVAARLRHAPDGSLALAGPGLRDVTRIAGSDPMLWAQILSANAPPVLEVLREVRGDLDELIAALEALGGERPQSPATGARAVLARLVEQGRSGRDRIPGKHGGVPTPYTVVTVLVPDQPGALGQLFADIGAAGVNVEELSLEHAPGRAVGLLEVSVLPALAEPLEAALDAAGWHVVG